MATRVPAQVFPLGEIIAEELAARRWTEADLARIADCEPAELAEVVSGKQSISAGMAERLGHAFGTSARYWLNLDTAYRRIGRRQQG